MPHELIVAVMAMYEEASTYVNTPDGPTDIFRVWAGVLQGDTLAPYLFICVIDVILRRIFKKIGTEIGFKFVTVSGDTVYLTDLDFANDLVIIIETEENAESVLQELQNLAGEYGLEVNFKPGKTEIMAIGKHSTTRKQIKNLEGKNVRIVTEYKYLGANLSLCSTELDRRISMSWAVLVKLKPLLLHNLTVKARFQIFSRMVDCYQKYEVIYYVDYLPQMIFQNVDGRSRLQ